MPIGYILVLVLELELRSSAEEDNGYWFPHGRAGFMFMFMGSSAMAARSPSAVCRATYLFFVGVKRKAPLLVDQS